MINKSYKDEIKRLQAASSNKKLKSTNIDQKAFLAFLLQKNSCNPINKTMLTLIANDIIPAYVQVSTQPHTSQEPR